MVANGDGSISGAQSQTGSTGDGGGNGILLNNNARWQGAMMATKALQLSNNSKIDGPTIGSTVVVDNNVIPDAFPTITQVPAGMPGIQHGLREDAAAAALLRLKTARPRPILLGRMPSRPPSCSPLPLALGSFLNVVAARGAAEQRSIVRLPLGLHGLRRRGSPGTTTFRLSRGPCCGGAAGAATSRIRLGLPRGRARRRRCSWRAASSPSASPGHGSSRRSSAPCSSRSRRPTSSTGSPEPGRPARRGHRAASPRPS